MPYSKGGSKRQKVSSKGFGQPKSGASTLIYDVHWFYNKAHDRVGFTIKKFRYVIAYDVISQKWRISNVKGLWKFSAEDEAKWEDLPGWFQASAPHWRDHFSTLVIPHAPLRAMP